jgi:hypothetical protein
MHWLLWLTGGYVTAIWLVMGLGSWLTSDVSLFDTPLATNSEIYIRDHYTGVAYNLSRHPGRDTLPAWSGNGQKIVFCSDRDGQRDVYEIRPDGTGLRNLTRETPIFCGGSWIGN